jgi:hypothetical protein
MVGEIIPEIYDIEGKPTVTPISRKNKKLFHGTFPMGRYISQPLEKQCKDFKELRQFLRDCKYISDKEQFNKEDYWIPPEEFEITKKGDCDDFALWTWRQLLGMGFNVRYVIGCAGKYGEGHAWVTMKKDGKQFIVEPLASPIGCKLPRLSFSRYEPTGSVSWDGKQLHYYIHEKRDFTLPIRKILLLGGEWLFFWLCFWIKFLFHLCLMPYYLIRKFIKKFLLSFHHEETRG